MKIVSEEQLSFDSNLFPILEPPLRAPVSHSKAFRYLELRLGISPVVECFKIDSNKWLVVVHYDG